MLAKKPPVLIADPVIQLTTLSNLDECGVWVGIATGEIATYSKTQPVVFDRKEIVAYYIWADLQARVGEVENLLYKESSIDVNIMFHLPLFYWYAISRAVSALMFMASVIHMRRDTISSFAMC
jgi:hypothetical protein